jgi:hypothetical protein
MARTAAAIIFWKDESKAMTGNRENLKIKEPKVERSDGQERGA